MAQSAPRDQDSIAAYWTFAFKRQQSACINYFANSAEEELSGGAKGSKINKINLSSESLHETDPSTRTSSIIVTLAPLC